MQLLLHTIKATSSLLHVMLGKAILNLRDMNALYRNSCIPLPRLLHRWRHSVSSLICSAAYCYVKSCLQLAIEEGETASCDQFTYT